MFDIRLKHRKCHDHSAKEVHGIIALKYQKYVTAIGISCFTQQEESNSKTTREIFYIRAD